MLYFFRLIWSRSIAKSFVAGVCASTLSNSGPREFHSHFSCCWNRARGADISALTTVTKYKKKYTTKNVMKKNWKMLLNQDEKLSREVDAFCRHDIEQDVDTRNNGDWDSIFFSTHNIFSTPVFQRSLCVVFFVFSRVNFYAINAADTSELGLRLYANVSGRR